MRRITSDSSTGAASREAVEAITVRLGSLAAQSLSVSGNPRPDRLERTLLQAVSYYLGPGKGTPGWAFPSFLVADSEPDGPIAVELERPAWNEILAEAERQGVEPDALLQHAALFFGAARDAGQLTDRIIEDLDREPFGSGSVRGS